jgi:hypothetical protein
MDTFSAPTSVEAGSVWITAAVEDVPPDEVFRRLSEPVYADAMRQAQEA